MDGDNGTLFRMALYEKLYVGLGVEGFNFLGRVVVKNVDWYRNCEEVTGRWKMLIEGVYLLKYNVHVLELGVG